MKVRPWQILLIKKCTVGKCSVMWNKWSRSVQAAEVIKEELTASFVILNDIGWNAHYDALDQLRVIV